MDEVEARLLMPGDDVTLDLVTQHSPFGVEDHQAGPDLLGEAEQIKLSAESAMIAALGLLDALLVGPEVLLGGPGGAVDALQGVP